MPIFKLFLTGLILSHGKLSSASELTFANKVHEQDRGASADKKTLPKNISGNAHNLRFRSMLEHELRDFGSRSNHLRSRLRGIEETQKQKRNNVIMPRKQSYENRKNHRISRSHLRTEQSNLTQLMKLKDTRNQLKKNSAKEMESRRGLPSCDDVEDTPAGEYTCGARIKYLMDRGQTLEVAVSTILGENHPECACGDIHGETCPAPSGDYVEIFRDDFDNVIDQDIWTYETGAGPGNGEQQMYVKDPKNSYTEDGVLKIKATKGGDGKWEAARINTFDKFDFSFGRVETKVKISKEAGGPFPAVWALGVQHRRGLGWPLCGEIDVMEYQSLWRYIPASLHFQDHNSGNSLSYQDHDIMNGFEDTWHVYAMEWTPDSITFFHEDRVVGCYKKPADANLNSWPYAGSADNNPFYLIINVAIDPEWGSKTPSDMTEWTFEVDYISVSQKDGEFDYTLKGQHSTAAPA